MEMAAILMDIKPGDEVIVPSYTFVSTANAFALRGAKIKFADSRNDHPGIDEGGIEELITSRTKAIVVVHYAGVACDMSKIMLLSVKHNLFVVEDAAQAIDSFYTFPDGTRKPLGGIGHFGAFSFHETKNIISGEGGMLVVNEEKFINRAEIIREKGTNRSAFFRGEINKYEWMDIGSSFLPSEIIAAFLYAQVENLDKVQAKRKEIWGTYRNELEDTELSGVLKRPVIPDYATNNSHMFYILCRSLSERTTLITFLKSKGILPVFHYISLHRSAFYVKDNPLTELKQADFYSDHLLRLPIYYELETEQVKQICNTIKSYFEKEF